MEIYATIRQKVEIDPIQVVERLKQNFLGDSKRWVRLIDGQYFIEQERSAGSHSYDEIVRELNEKELKYYEALVIVENFLKK